MLLKWRASGAVEPEFCSYAVYRGNAPGAVIAPANFLIATTDTTLIDPGASAAQAYCDTPRVTRLAVYPNAPNPFNPTTAIRFALSERAAVTLAVHDQTGRRVAVLMRSAVLDAGLHAATWHGVDDDGVQVPSSVYSGRLEAGGAVATRKMMLLM